jgi:hypothetical protein
MGRLFVRQAVAIWFAPPSVLGLYTVYRAEPKQVPGTDFFAGAPAGTPSGAVAYPYVESQNEHRIAIGGPHSGWKQGDYDVALIVRFVSNQGTGEAAQDDHDSLMDAIVARLRADRQLGTTNAQTPYIFQAGEGDAVGGADVHVLSDLPKQNGQQVVIWSAVRFRCVEMDLT